MLPLLLAAMLTLGACSTMEGLKDDMVQGFHSITDSVAEIVDVNEEKKKLPVYDGTCPGVSVRPDLRRLVEFYDDSNPSESTRVSEITILDVKNTCRVEKDMLVMQIDLSLTGKTGPRARMKPGDKPSFAYPYFVAVTDPKGTVLSKEIFAAPVSYEANQNEFSKVESIFQNMPFPDASVGQIYNVIVGFQLTPEQLAYNQANK